MTKQKINALKNTKNLAKQLAKIEVGQKFMARDLENVSGATLKANERYGFKQVDTIETWYQINDDTMKKKYY